MQSQEPHINKLADHLFRQESGKMTAVLTRILGFGQFEAAQDIVQDTLLHAMHAWRKEVPPNPSAWLYKVARNKAIDYIRRQATFNGISPRYRYLIEQQQENNNETNTLFFDDEIRDSQLRMIFACCHPSIAIDSQIALTLKTLCGLNNAEIARAFLTQEDTIAKRIYRAKEKIRIENIKLEAPAGTDIATRLDAVLHSLYLLFNEGYSSSHPEQLIRESLCADAMRLCQLLTLQASTNYPRVRALMALMCFQSSRFYSRLDDKGNIILLKYQDRSTWHRGLIATGFSYLDAAAIPFEVSAFHLEAAIASLHAASPSFEKTDWNRIHYLYDLLYQVQPGPVVAMNRALAHAYAGHAEQAIAALKSIDGLQQYHIYHASIGEMYLELGSNEMAAPFFERAMTLTTSVPELQLLQHKLQHCRPNL